MSMAITARCAGLAALQDEGSRTNPHGDNDRDGNEVLFADTGCAAVHDVLSSEARSGR